MPRKLRRLTNPDKQPYNSPTLKQLEALEVVDEKLPKSLKNVSLQVFNGYTNEMYNTAKAVLSWVKAGTHDFTEGVALERGMQLSLERHGFYDKNYKPLLKHLRWPKHWPTSLKREIQAELDTYEMACQGYSRQQIKDLDKSREQARVREQRIVASRFKPQRIKVADGGFRDYNIETGEYDKHVPRAAVHRVNAMRDEAFSARVKAKHDRMSKGIWPRW